ncbi:hypothetical protein MPER_04247 [Moniliophthora perniciosa FA553]|nr:hypothetical protein MPER_04247 [Moniliophthora perniciosa FA553]
MFECYGNHRRCKALVALQRIFQHSPGVQFTQAAPPPTMLCDPVIAIGPMKYQLWYPDWGYYLLPDSFKNNNGQCAVLVNNYWRDGPFGSTDKPWSCTLVLDCILKDTTEHGSQMLSASLVLLGLTPTMLASLGMSVAEDTMLSFEHPLLSTLLSFGSVAVYPSRILTCKRIPYESIPGLANISSGTGYSYLPARV